MNVFEIINNYLDKEKSGVLATVIERTGSAPRDVGAKMFIGEDRKTFGTVGGGLLESKAYQEALSIMHTGTSKTYSISMDAVRIDADDMLCGGNVTILLEPATKKYQNLYRQITALQEKRQRGLILTNFSTDIFSKTLLDQAGNITGDIPGPEMVQRVQEFLYERQPMLLDGYFIDPVTISFPLYIFGAGHVSQRISQIAKTADFYITVIDDRKEFANSERFPNADAVMVADIHDAFCCLDFTGNEFVIIATRSHEYDAIIIREALSHNTRYIGMIGSKRKVKIILDSIRDEGFDESALKRIHAPVGIPINAETPQEIAISIVAELVKTKNSPHTSKVGGSP